MKLLLLIGSNPLPNYLAAKIIVQQNTKSTPIEEIYLIYTPATESIARKLSEQFDRDFPSISVRLFRINSGYNIKDVCGVVNEALLKDSHLNYTGGTKIMSAQIYNLWKQYNVKSNQASYVEDLKGVLIFDDGTEVEIDIKLDKDVVVKLHGIEGAFKKTSSAYDPDQNDIQKMARIACDDGKSFNEIYELFTTEENTDITWDKFKSDKTKTKKYEEVAAGFNFKLGDPNYTNNFQTWAKFFRGGWLEMFVEASIKSARLAHYTETSFVGKIDGREFEVDVLAIRGHRLYCVSCTIASELKLCKQKAFEIIMRSHQLGGDLARCALVCFADQRMVAELSKDVKSFWHSPNELKVFGKEHITEWKSGYFASLETWLKS